MRAIDLYETDLKALGIKRDGTGEKLTLRVLNKLKRIRERRRLLADQKQAVIRAMYGGGDLSERTSDEKMARAELDLAKQRVELELDQKRHEIEQLIAAAKLSDDARETVSAMARRTLGRKLKD